MLWYSFPRDWFKRKKNTWPFHSWVHQIPPPPPFVRSALASGAWGTLPTQQQLCLHAWRHHVELSSKIQQSGGCRVVWCVGGNNVKRVFWFCGHALTSSVISCICTYSMPPVSTVSCRVRVRTWVASSGTTTSIGRTAPSMDHKAKSTSKAKSSLWKERVAWHDGQRTVKSPATVSSLEKMSYLLHIFTKKNLKNIHC